MNNRSTSTIKWLLGTLKPRTRSITDFIIRVLFKTSTIKFKVPYMKQLLQSKSHLATNRTFSKKESSIITNKIILTSKVIILTTITSDWCRTMPSSQDSKTIAILEEMMITLILDSIRKILKGLNPERP
jgi:hypothetical protein